MQNKTSIRTRNLEIRIERLRNIKTMFEAQSISFQTKSVNFEKCVNSKSCCTIDDKVPTNEEGKLCKPNKAVDTDNQHKYNSTKEVIHATEKEKIKITGVMDNPDIEDLDSDCTDQNPVAKELCPDSEDHDTGFEDQEKIPGSEELNPGPIGKISGSEELNPSPAGKDLGSEELNSDPVGNNPYAEELNPVPAERNPGSIELNPGSEELNPGSAGKDLGSEELNSRPARKNPGSEELNPSLAGTNPCSEEKNPGSTGKNHCSKERNPGLAGKNPSSEELNPVSAGKNPGSEELYPVLAGKNSVSEELNPSPTGKHNISEEPNPVFAEKNLDSEELNPSPVGTNPGSAEKNSGFKELNPGSNKENPVSKEKNPCLNEHDFGSEGTSLGSKYPCQEDPELLEKNSRRAVKPDNSTLTRLVLRNSLGEVLSFNYDEAKDKLRLIEPVPAVDSKSTQSIKEVRPARKDLKDPSVKLKKRKRSLINLEIDMVSDTFNPIKKRRTGKDEVRYI